MLSFWKDQLPYFPLCSGPSYRNSLAFSLGVELLGYMGFRSGSDSKESACNEVNPCVGKIPLEKRMATHSSILVWRNPWTDELGGLQSMGLQRVGLSNQRFHFYGNSLSSLSKICGTVFHRGCTTYLATRLQFFHITNTCYFLFLRFIMILVWSGISLWFWFACPWWPVSGQRNVKRVFALLLRVSPWITSDLSSCQEPLVCELQKAANEK